MSDKMNSSPVIEVNGNLMKFKVVHVSASDHGHGGGDQTIIYYGFDIQEAIKKEKEQADWGSHHIEMEGWR